MKKLLVSFVMMFLASNVFAGTADLFHYDASKVKKALVNAEVLDNMISQSHLTLDQLNLDTPVLSNFKAETSSMMMQGEDVLGIPAFWWGCVLGWVGILVVYLVTEDKEAAKKALWGCLVGTGIGIVIYVIYAALIVGAWASAASSY